MKRYVFAATFSLISALSFGCFADNEFGDGVVRPALAAPVYRYYDDTSAEDDGVSKNDSDDGSESAADKDLKSQKPIDDSNKIWARKSIQETRIDIRESHRVAPDDRSSELNYGGSEWSQFYASPKVFAWAAPDIRYQPLYFEDVALERYGQTMGWQLQPYRSGVHFFKSFVLLPNQMRHDSPGSCDYPLGFCRPGTCVPATRQQQYFGFATR